jgi:hypothetical protein
VKLPGWIRAAATPPPPATPPAWTTAQFWAVLAGGVITVLGLAGVWHVDTANVDGYVKAAAVVVSGLLTLVWSHGRTIQAVQAMTVAAQERMHAKAAEVDRYRIASRAALRVSVGGTEIRPPVVTSGPPPVAP